jgi:hypothetical protein
MCHLYLSFLTLLWYHEKSYVICTMGSIWPHWKKTRIKTQFITMFFFPPNNISQHRFVLKYRQTDRHDFVLGNFDYIEADREKYRKCVTKRKQYTKKKKKNASDSSLLCKLACQYHLSPKCFQYFLWSSFCRQLSILHGRYYGVYLSPSGNKHK